MLDAAKVVLPYIFSADTTEISFPTLMSVAEIFDDVDEAPVNFEI